MVLGQATPGQWYYLKSDGTLAHINHLDANAPGHLSKNGVNYANMAFSLAQASSVVMPTYLVGARIYISLGSPMYIPIAPDDSGWGGPKPNRWTCDAQPWRIRNSRPWPRWSTDHLPAAMEPVGRAERRCVVAPFSSRASRIFRHGCRGHRIPGEIPPPRRCAGRGPGRPRPSARHLRRPDRRERPRGALREGRRRGGKDHLLAVRDDAAALPARPSHAPRPPRTPVLARAHARGPGTLVMGPPPRR